MKTETRNALIASLALLVTLSAWSFGAPIGAQGDADHHISSIWCGWGESPGMCEDFGLNGTARVPFMFQMCNGRPINYWPNCPIEETSDKMQVLRTSVSQTQSLYYSIMRVFASPNPTGSILAMRMFNSFLASVVFFFLTVLTIGRLRIAALTAWMLTLVPVAIQTFPNINPSSWSYLGVMSAWAFLHAFLTALPNERRHKRAVLIAYLISVGLTAATRWDAFIFVVFSSVLVIFGVLLQKQQLNIKNVFKLVIAGSVIGAVAWQISPFVRLLTHFDLPESYPNSQFFLFQLTHIPGTIAEVWQYNSDQLVGAPAVIGITGISLVAIFLGMAFQKSNQNQMILTGLVFAFICLSILRMSITWATLLPPQGAYILALVTVLIGVATLYSSSDTQLMMSISGRAMVITLLSISHALSLFTYMEFYVRRGQDIGVFAHLSLNGSWWWKFGPSANFSYLMGALMFPIFLIFAWQTVPTNRSSHVNRQSELVNP